MSSSSHVSVARASSSRNATISPRASEPAVFLAPEAPLLRAFGSTRKSGKWLTRAVEETVVVVDYQDGLEDRKRLSPDRIYGCDQVIPPAF